MKVRITKDSMGICAWPEDAELSFNGDDVKTYADKKCEYRGTDNLYDFVEDILELEDMKVGDLVEIHITVGEPPKCKRCGTYKWVVGKMIRGFVAVKDIIAAKKKHSQQDLNILEEVMKALPPPKKEKA